MDAIRRKYRTYLAMLFSSLVFFGVIFVRVKFNTPVAPGGAAGAGTVPLMIYVLAAISVADFIFVIFLKRSALKSALSIEDPERKLNHAFTKSVVIYSVANTPLVFALIAYLMRAETVYALGLIGVSLAAHAFGFVGYRQFEEWAAG